MEIKPYHKNAKKHPKKQVDQIANSIKEFGMNQPIVVDKDGVIIVGHGRWEAIKKLGLEVKPEWIKTVDLTEEQAKAYRLADNKLNESEWDMDLVVEELKGLSDEMLELTGFDKDLIIEPDEKDDEVPEVPTEPQSKLGDLYELGPHRVLCGDSTQEEAVLRLMDGKKADCVVTDPPYNTGMEGNGNTFDYDWTKKKEKARLSHMFMDNFTEEDFVKLITNSLQNSFNNTKGECAFYVFIDWRRGGQIKGLMETLMPVKNVIVWDKQVHGLGSDYKSTYELCVVGKKGKPEINNRYGLDYQDIWRLQRTMGRNKDHATAKPVDLLTKPITHASKQDDIILDLFLGSGSTLIASQKTGRTCYGMELDPKYVDVIVQRYCDYVGDYNIIKNGQPILWQKTKAEDQQ
jgi:site-specific DNA-methyltransferase (adenine-specific)